MCCHLNCSSIGSVSDSGEGGWSPWSHGPCSHNCGKGTRTSTRNCTTPDHPDCCPGNSTIIEACEERKCSGEQVVCSIFTMIRGDVLCSGVWHASSSLWEKDDSPDIWQLSIVSDFADIWSDALSFFKLQHSPLIYPLHSSCAVTGSCSTGSCRPFPPAGCIFHYSHPTFW